MSPTNSSAASAPQTGAKHTPGPRCPRGSDVDGAAHAMQKGVCRWCGSRQGWIDLSDAGWWAGYRGESRPADDPYTGIGYAKGAAARALAKATPKPEPAEAEMLAGDVSNNEGKAARREREEQRAALLMQVQSNLRDPLTSRIY